MRAACFGKAKRSDLAFANQFLDGSRHILDRNPWIDSMLIQEIDAIGA
jgi:hypothetical protein